MNNNVWQEINGQIWLKLKLDTHTRTMILNGGITYDVTEETINGIVDGLGFKEG